jgi:hypothetical protein
MAHLEQAGSLSDLCQGSQSFLLSRLCVLERVYT